MEIPGIEQLTSALHSAWSAETGYADIGAWNDQNPARGQCVTSSLVMQDYLGGDIIRYAVNGDNINDIRAEYGVEMDFLQKSTDPKAQETGEVELEITGSRQNIKDAAKRVESIVAEASDFVTEVLKIDHKYHKSIVGSGGHILRDIISKAGGEEIRNKSVDIPNADSENKDITVQGPQKFVKKECRKSLSRTLYKVDLLL